MSTQAIPSNTEASILVRILQSNEREMTPDVSSLSSFQAIAGGKMRNG